MWQMKLNFHRMVSDGESVDATTDWLKSVHLVHKYKMLIWQIFLSLSHERTSAHTCFDFQPSSTFRFKLDWHCGNFHCEFDIRHVHGCFNLPQKKSYMHLNAHGKKNAIYTLNDFFCSCPTVSKKDFHYISFFLLNTLSLFLCVFPFP